MGDQRNDGGISAEGSGDISLTSGSVDGFTATAGSSTPPDGTTGEALSSVVHGATDAGALQEEAIKSKKTMKKSQLKKEIRHLRRSFL